jgi:hypothetical protein
MPVADLECRHGRLVDSTANIKDEVSHVKAIRLVLLLLVSVAAFAQVFISSGFGGSGFSTANSQLTLRSDPPSSPLLQLFGSAITAGLGPMAERSSAAM